MYEIKVRNLDGALEKIQHTWDEQEEIYIKLDNVILVHLKAPQFENYRRFLGKLILELDCIRNEYLRKLDIFGFDMVKNMVRPLENLNEIIKKERNKLDSFMN